MDYDQREYAGQTNDAASPLEKLKYVMAESGMTPGELAEVLGASQPLTSHILTGSCNLTIATYASWGSISSSRPDISCKF